MPFEGDARAAARQPVAIVAAVALNGVIGRGNALPWRLPGDLAHFKRLTMGGTLVVGRRTYESIGRPLPGRRTIVVTRHDLTGVETARSLAEAVDRASTPVFLAGGAAIYADGMAISRTLHITRVHATPSGDTRFPDIDPTRFALARSVAGARGINDEHDVVYELWVRL